MDCQSRGAPIGIIKKNTEQSKFWWYILFVKCLENLIESYVLFYVKNINSSNPFKIHSIKRNWWLLKPIEDMDLNVSLPAHRRKVALQVTPAEWATASAVKHSVLFQKKNSRSLPCTDSTNLCYLQRSPVFAFTNRKSLMLGFYFKHALKLWVFSRKNESLPITLTCYSTNGTNSGDKSEHVWAELFKKTLDQPSKILFYRVRAYAIFCCSESY